MKTLDEFAKEHKQLLRQEELILDATELICKIMKDNGISKAELADRLGKSKAFVTQCLCGHQNLTLRTLADIFTVLGYQARFGAEPYSVEMKEIPRLYPVKHWAFECKASGTSLDLDLAASASGSSEGELCDAA
jgi:transcriptional regulator with XRE-family HTH domain